MNQSLQNEIHDLKCKSALQQTFFNLAMDRANAAEARVTDLERENSVIRGEAAMEVERLGQIINNLKKSIDHPVKCPNCKHHFLPYIDPANLR